jgi:hypothetical protein
MFDAPNTPIVVKPSATMIALVLTGPTGDDPDHLVCYDGQLCWATPYQIRLIFSERRAYINFV